MNRAGRERAFAHWRRAAGLTAVRAAIRLGCSPGHLSALENCRKPLSTRLAAKMSRVYGVSLGQLFIPPVTAGGAGNAQRAGGRVETAPALGEARQSTA